MSEQDEKASYIDILEEQLAAAEEEIGLLRMEAEHEAIQRDHELAWWMEWHRNLDKENATLESELDTLGVEKDHEYALLERDFEQLEADANQACVTNHLGCIERWEKAIEDAVSWRSTMEVEHAILERYVAHFDKHPHGYMSKELNKITRDAKGVLGR